MRGRRERNGPRTILAAQTVHDPILAAGLRYGKYIVTLIRLARRAPLLALSATGRVKAARTLRDTV